MHEENPEEQAEQAARRRPRVVDKRVSARMSDPEAAAGPEVPSDSPLGFSTETADATSDVSSESSPPGGDVWTPEREAEAQAIAQQIAETPSLDWVANVAVTLANVAGTKLDVGNLPDARLAIDAFAALIDGVGKELGDAEAPLRQTLAQMRMAYAQMAAATPPSQ